MYIEKFINKWTVYLDNDRNESISTFLTSTVGEDPYQKININKKRW